MFFVGTFDGTIDAKNRLSIPYQIRRKLDERRDGHGFYVMPGPRRDTLALYPEAYFERQETALAGEGLSEEARVWCQFEYSQCALLDPDGQGRVLLPERLLKRTGIGKELKLIGVRDHLEVWNRSDFEAFENGQWDNYPEAQARAMHERRAFAALPPASEPAA